MNTKKCCKVIAVYFGARRTLNNNPTTPEASLELFQHHIEWDKKIDPGIDCDVILVNNQAGYHGANVYLDSLDGTPSFRGTYKCHTRPNTGGSFAAYDYAYQQHKDEYDYWCFLEDDVIITEDNIYLDAVNTLESDPTIGFVSLAPIVNTPNGWHSGGGCGFSSKTNLDTVSVNNAGHLPHNNGTDYTSFENAELAFTIVYGVHGLRLVNLEGCSPFCSNYKTHASQASHLSRFDESERHIYKVGI